MSDTVIKVEGLYKKFCNNLRRSMYYGSVDVARSMFGMEVNSAELRKNEFWALQDINFELRRGETLGLIGQNGCGKTTLLRLLNGIFPPDRGQITIKGRIGALIAVGAGFHPHMTGRENIYLNGTILGMNKAEIKRKFDEIVDFAEIGDFLDAPVATYSSGMHVRLGFAIAINAPIDILLVDEILAVGDYQFQKKCFDKLINLVKLGVGIIVVSHDISIIERICNKGIVLNKGYKVTSDLIREAVKSYMNIIHSENKHKIEQTFNEQCDIVVGGIGNVTIFNVQVFETNKQLNNNNIEFSRNFCIGFDYSFKQKNSNNFQIRVGIRTKEGIEIQKMFLHEKPYRDEYIYINENIKHIPPNGSVQIEVKNQRLMPQTYIIDVAIQSLDSGVSEGGFSNIATFNIIEPVEQKIYFEYGYRSVLNMDYIIEVK